MAKQKGWKINEVEKSKSKTLPNTTAGGTVSPTGLSVTRSGNTFTFSWKVGDADYASGQWVRYQINNGAVQGDIPVSPVLTSYSVNCTATDVSVIRFWVCGTRKPYQTSTSSDAVSSKTKKDKSKKVKTITTTTTTTTVVTTVVPNVSEWAGITWEASIPVAPSLSYSRQTSTSGTFTWSISPDNSGSAVFRDVELQTCTSRNTNNPPGSGWVSSAKGNSGSVSYTESLSGGNIIRWVRVRSRGPAGNSGWSYQYHAYGAPQAPNLITASSVQSGGVMRTIAEWMSDINILYPIDTVTLQYVIAVPGDLDLTAPLSGWQDSISVGGYAGRDKVVANISANVGTDECMWVRLKAEHDDFDAYSRGALVFTGALATPDIEATPEVQSGDVTINIVENTGCTVAKTAIFYRSERNPSYDQIVAVLPRGTTRVVVNIPEISISDPDPVETSCFGAWAFVGTNTDTSVKASMRSGVATDSDLLARPPAWLELSEGKQDDSVRIKWPWTWKAATSAELAWADHDDAWESTDEPSTYEISDKHIESWIIAKLGMGKKWFFRVRLNYADDDEKIIGPWSNMYDYDLATIPDRPVIVMSKNVINQNGTVTAMWAFSSEDGTVQDYADVCIATIENDTVVYGDVIAHAISSQTMEIQNEWETGKTYYLCLRVTSSGGKQSEWSEPAALYVAPPIELNTAECSLIDEDGRLFLKELPLSITITGAGVSGKTIVSIVRAEEYHIYRPDDSVDDGFAGETIATINAVGEGSFTITSDDLVGYLDDGAKYLLRCTAIDEYEQTSTKEIPFTVQWSHQAGRPSAEVKIDEWQRIAIIKPIAPANYQEGDVCDIYRISSDKPELIVLGAQFGQTYVDPYPAFGGHCGHRLVTRTANDDYITEDGKLAWFLADIDIGDAMYEKSMIIDVNGEQIELPYNIELQNVWTKDFKRTTYLGGSVQGDWNPAVTRDLTANTVLLRGRDLDEQLAVRNLAGYAGPAHIRTPDGSSMTADIQVRETYTYQSKRLSYSLAVKVIDPQEPEGMTYKEWIAKNPAR